MIWLDQHDVTGLCIGLKTHRRTASTLKLTAKFKMSWSELVFNTLLRYTELCTCENRYQTPNLKYGSIYVSKFQEQHNKSVVARTEHTTIPFT